MKKNLFMLIVLFFFCVGTMIPAHAETEIGFSGAKEVLAVVQNIPQEVVPGLYSVDVRLLPDESISRTLLTGIPELKKGDRVKLLVLVVRDDSLANLVSVAVRP